MVDLITSLHYSIFELCYIERGDMGECKGDKIHCCFHWKLNHGLTVRLKQSYKYNTSLELSKVVSNIFELYFLFFLIFPRFDIAQVISWLLSVIFFVFLFDI